MIKKSRLAGMDRRKPALPLPTSYENELEMVWGKKWGAQNEIGKLREVLVQTPGSELKPPPRKQFKWYGLTSKIDVDKMKEEHRRFVETLRSEGVNVHFMDAPAGAHGPYSVLQGLWGTRDYGFVVNGGAIVCRPSLPWDRGAEIWWAKRVIELGCPILLTVHGFGTLEGGNVIWLDSKHVCIGRSIRTNQIGIDQASFILKSIGVEEIRVVPIPGWIENIEWPAGGFAHLDCVFGYVDSGLAVIYPAGVPFDFLEYLKEIGVRLIEVSPDEAKNYACNTLAISPGKVLMHEGFSASRRKLERQGVDVIPVEMEEFKKAGGGPHCATAPLIRELGPKL